MPPYDVQGYVIVFQVTVMTVALPLARFYVYLDVPGYLTAVYDEDGILKVTAGGVAASARVDYGNLFTIGGNQFGYRLALPDTGNEFLCDLCIHVLLHDCVYVKSKNLALFRWYPDSLLVDDMFYLPAFFLQLGGYKAAVTAPGQPFGT